MSLTYEEVRDKAMELTAEERGQLVDELYDSVLSDEDLQFDDEMRPSSNVGLPKSTPEPPRPLIPTRRSSQRGKH